MTYEEMIARTKEAIAAGKPLHGLMMDIAIDLAIEEMEEDARWIETETAKLIDSLAS